MRRLLVVLLALLLALGGAALVLWYVSQADERAIADQQPTEVWVATQAIPSGTTLRDAERKDLIEETRVPAKAVPTGALSDITADNRSLVALSDVTPGEVLLDARFGDTPTGTKAIEVPPGRIAVSMELSDPARVGTFVTPGSHIVIYRSTKMVALGDSPRATIINEQDFQGTDVVLADALVIGMGDTALSAPNTATDEEEAGTQQASFLVTVAVTPKQALHVVHAAANHRLWTGLRGSDVDIDPKSSVNDLDWPGGLP